MSQLLPGVAILNPMNLGAGSVSGVPIQRLQGLARVAQQLFRAWTTDVSARSSLALLEGSTSDSLEIRRPLTAELQGHQRTLSQCTVFTW
jgi:hypothetical protein